MRRNEIFISHTSRERATSELRDGDTPAKHRHRKGYVRALIDALVEELGRRTMDPWLDRREVEASDEFQPLLALGLARCASAVVLVDKDALDSGFMRDEAVFLGWRRAAEPDFSVLPVLLGGVTELEWNASQLGQAGQLSRFSVLRLPKKANRQTALEHARIIADAIPVDPPESDPVAQRWIEEVEHFLSLVAPVFQVRAARALGIDENTFSSLRRGPRLLAGAMLHANLIQGYQAMSEIRDFMTADARHHLGRRLIPLWVDLSLAGRLMTTSRAEQVHTVGLGAGSLDLAGHAVQRAMAHDPGLRMPQLSTVAGERYEQDLLEQFDETIRLAVGLEHDHPPEEIEQSLSNAGVVVFVLIDTRAAPAKAVNTIVATLVKRFPGFVFGLVAPTAGPEWKAIRGAKHVLTRNAEEDRATQFQVNQIRMLMEDDR